MLICVEGIAKTGKSTMVAQLVREFSELGFPTLPVKFTRDDMLMMTAPGIFGYFKERANDPDTLWIHDRGHATEWVYSKALHRVDTVYPDDAKFWEEDYNLGVLPVATIFLWASEARRGERRAIHAREREPNDRLINLWWGIYLGMTMMPHVQIDTSQLSLADATELALMGLMQVPWFAHRFMERNRPSWG